MSIGERLAAKFEPNREDTTLRGRIVLVDSNATEGVFLWVQSLEANSTPIRVFYAGNIDDVREGAFVNYQPNPRSPSKIQIVGIDNTPWSDAAGLSGQLPSMQTPAHNNSHVWRPGYKGADPITIDPRMISHFRVTPTNPASMKCNVAGGWYAGATNYELYAGGKTKDFTADIPSTSGKAVIIAISLNTSTGALAYETGTEFVDGDIVYSSLFPTVTVASQKLLSAVRLVNGMTTITESNFDYEMRVL